MVTPGVCSALPWRRKSPGKGTRSTTGRRRAIASIGPRAFWHGRGPAKNEAGEAATAWPASTPLPETFVEIRPCAPGAQAILLRAFFGGRGRSGGKGGGGWLFGLRRRVRAEFEPPGTGVHLAGMRIHSAGRSRRVAIARIATAAAPDSHFADPGRNSYRNSLTVHSQRYISTVLLLSFTSPDT